MFPEDSRTPPKEAPAAHFLLLGAKVQQPKATLAGFPEWRGGALASKG